MNPETVTAHNGLMTVDDVQKALGRSRASVYRYANTDPEHLNPDYDPTRLNPEFRTHKDEPIVFHPNEVARFAQDVLGIKHITIEVRESAETVTHRLLKEILSELRHIRTMLDARS
ncbi:MAG: resolvase [Synechococcales cyanobacterium T60_A2020_003]|nr:resolvase [Synechococcales cyanobacterium T60_A2020_003]